MAQLFIQMANHFYSSGDFSNALVWYETLLKYQVERGFTDTHDTKYVIAKCLYQCGRLEEAVALFSEYIVALKNQYPADHDEVLEAQNELALCFIGKKEYPKALELFLAILKVDERKGKFDKDTLVTKGNIALCYSNTDKLHEAKKMQEEILKEQIKMLGADHPHVTYTRNNLAACLERLGDSAGALKILQSTSSNASSNLGDKHLATLQSKQNQIACLSELGRLEDALNLSVEVQRDIERQYGNKHPTYLKARLNMALIMTKLEKYDEAILLCLELKSLYEEAFGPKHPDLISVMGMLASCYSDKDDHTKALEIQEDTLRKFSGSDVRLLSTLKNNMAQTLFRLQRPRDGLVVMESVEHEMTKLLGENHPDVRLVKKNKATLLFECDMFAESAKCYRELEKLYKAAEDNDSLDSTRTQLIKCYIEVNDCNQGLEVYSNVRGKAQKDNELTLAKNQLALKLANFENYHSHALRIFREVEEIMEKVVQLSPTNGALLNTKLNIASVYEEMGQQKEADALYQYVERMKTGR